MSNNDAEEKFLRLDDREVVWPIDKGENLNNTLGVNSCFVDPIISSEQLKVCIKRLMSLKEPLKSRLFGEGIEGEVLRFGSQGWQKGKIRVKIAIEFCADEPEVEETPENNNSETNQPESPLDDLRRQLLDRENSPS